MSYDCSKADYQEFRQLCEPLMRWLNDNCHPHVKVILDSVTAELVEGLTTHRLEFKEPTSGPLVPLPGTEGAKPVRNKHRCPYQPEWERRGDLSHTCPLCGLIVTPGLLHP